MIDVGANLGYFSLLWTGANPKNRCFAFEPAPRNIVLLKHNVATNRLQERIVVHEFALGASPGMADFSLGPPAETGWGGIVNQPTQDSITVQVKALDDVIEEERNPIALLKIDVEGFEARVLLGCKRLLLSKLIRVIWFEQNKVRMRALGLDVDEPIGVLRANGYRAFPMDDPRSELVNWCAVPEDARPS